MRPGELVKRYRLREKLGEGGMGEVYKAEDSRLHRVVALKFISPRFLSGMEARDRFEHEACAAASLRHPHINTVYEIDEWEGRPFIVMEYIEGQTLKDKIRERPLPIPPLLKIAFEAADGLEEAHAQGVIHRDIKSSNIMLDGKGRVRIMDFGLAQTTEQTRLTGTATVLGTAAYMSPEQAGGETIDARSDLWSLGVVLYEMVTGVLPFRGGSDQMILYALLNQPPEPATALRSGVPMELERIIDKCLSKDPQERYQTASDLKADLRRLMSELSSNGRTATAPGPDFVIRPGKRRLLLGAVLPIGLLLGLLVVLRFDAVRAWVGNLWSGPLPERKFLAFMPIDVVAPDPDLQLKAKGWEILLVNRLTQLESFKRDLWVLSPDSFSRLESVTAREVGKVFGVNLVIQARIVPVEENYVFALELIETKTSRILHSESVEFTRAETTTVYERIFNRLVEYIAPALKPDLASIELEGRPDDTSAGICYLEGIAHLKDSFSLEANGAAIDRLQRVNTIEPSFAPAYVDLAVAYWERWLMTKDSIWAEEAERVCREAIRADDHLIRGYTELGRILRLRAEYEEAVGCLTRAIRLDSRNVRAYLNLGVCYESLKQDEDAAAAYAKAIELKPDFPDVYNYPGLFNYFRRRYAAAEKILQTAVDKRIDNYLTNAYLGLVYFRQEKLDLAEEQFQMANRKNENSYCLTNIGYVHYLRGDFKGALDWYEKARQSGSTDSFAWGNLADAYRHKGDGSKAEECYQKAIELARVEIEVKPDDALACARLARYLAENGSRDEAEKWIAEARNLDPEGEDVLIGAIKVYELLRNRESALRAVERLIERKGSLVELKWDPDLAGLRGDTRLAALIGE